MNKKAYITPQMEVIELDTEVLMLEVSGGTGLDDTTSGGGMYGGDADANGRRGEWGNLWAQN